MDAARDYLQSHRVFLQELANDLKRQYEESTTLQEWTEPPFGPLNGFHNNLQRDAKPISWDPEPVFWYLTVWWIPLIMMSYLLVGNSKCTRPLRLCLAGAGLSLLYNGYTSYRFHDPKWNALANILGMFYFHIAVRYVEFALLAGPIVDPHIALGRPRIIAAFDLLLNQRMMYLGAVGMDAAAGPSNASLRGKPPKLERHVFHKDQGPRPRSRSRAVLRHLSHAFLCYAALDTMYVLLRWYGPSTFGPQGGAIVLLDGKHDSIGPAFADRVQFIAAPYLFGGVVVPKFIVRSLVAIGIPLSIYGGMSFWYHVGAVLTIGGGLWEVEVWDVDLFDSPLKATSLIDLWGKRWHQVFRHHFTIMSVSLLQLLQVPVNSLTIFPTTFLFSGLYHAIPSLAISPAPDFWAVVAMFYLSGLGCCLEVLYKRLTGMPVGGWPGRLWTWTFQANVGLIATNAWLNAGYAACSIFPEHGIGEYLARYLLPFFKVTVLNGE